MIGLGLGLSLGSGAVGFSPGNLGSSLVRWWDASDVSTLTLDGSAVTTWASKVGGFSLGAAANKPIWSATVRNGRPGVSADGTQFLTMDSVSGLPTGANPCTMVIVGYLDVAGNFPPFLSYGTSGVTDATRTVDGFSTTRNVGMSVWGTGHDTGVSWATDRVVIGRFIDADDRTAVVNGTNYPFTGGAMNTTTNEGRMFAAASIASGNCIGTIQEAMIINRDVTTAEIAGLTAYLSRKWGI